MIESQNLQFYSLVFSFDAISTCLRCCNTGIGYLFKYDPVTQRPIPLTLLRAIVAPVMLTILLTFYYFLNQKFGANFMQQSNLYKFVLESRFTSQILVATSFSFFFCSKQ